MSISKKLYRERKHQHLCTRCGKIAEFNKTLCFYHLQKANKNQYAMYARRKNEGLCPLCGEKLCNNRKICNQCLEKQISKPRDDVWIPRKDRQKHGLCLDCGQNNSTSNLYCNLCSKKRTINQSSIRKQNIMNGLCGYCGKRLLVKNRKGCVICIYKRNKWYGISKTRNRNMQKNKLLRDQIIQHYGGKCNCCGETERTFLAIDHIDGNGNIHRRKIKKRSGMAFCQWLINQNFPKKFQILCHNCNMSKYLNGGICAHKRRE